MRKHCTAIILGVLCLFLAHGAWALTFQVDFAQDGTYETNWTLDVGTSVLADIYVSEVPDPGLVGMGIDVTFDSALLAPGAGTGVDTSVWDGLYVYFLDTSTPGSVKMGGMRDFFSNPVSGDDIRLGTVEFEALAAGVSLLTLYDSDHGGSYSDFVLENSEVLDDALSGGIPLGEIRVVPEPSTLLLLGSGVLGLAVRRRRRVP